MIYTIIKTGVVLALRPIDMRELGLDKPTLYGDLHICGEQAIVYAPIQGLEFNTTHGQIHSLPQHYFWREPRKGLEFGILVMPAFMIEIHVDALHKIDLARWVAGGGAVIEQPMKDKPHGIVHLRVVPKPQ